LNIRVIDILEEHSIDGFKGNLKDEIQHEVYLWEPNSLEMTFKVERKVKEKLCQQGSLQITIIKMEVLLHLSSSNLQG